LASLLDKPGSEEETFLFAAIKKMLATDKNFYSRTLANIQGVTEDQAREAFRLASAKLSVGTTFVKRSVQ